MKSLYRIFGEGTFSAKKEKELSGASFSTGGTRPCARGPFGSRKEKVCPLLGGPLLQSCARYRRGEKSLISFLLLLSEERSLCGEINLR
ncbi:MAG TPA: hypothetical protein DEP42_06165 [Ruminococcaceae bacterium]|nr:hypothetical protein [Oscillospiraceae bacterium]